ncbi:putative cation-transporting ATPase F [Methylobrevis pamukkalensis]|uniref:Putative cation-transporting ATPase F n=1 Tax=Methylobrevis pamukkalensis TaxID=1439726 RepID=A0A1E3H431_9HYPH|nr:putative cation-transporting ATPase F [Methylobrevis pamukkalensis]
MQDTDLPSVADLSAPGQPASAGLSSAEAAAVLARVGPNTLPQPAAPSLARVFLRQFLSPLIYILLAAAVVSLSLGDAGDAAFIGIVLLLNGLIGTAQEYSAGRAAAALKQLEEPRARVVRDGAETEIAPAASCPATSCCWRPAAGCPPTCASSRPTTSSATNPC